MQIQPERAQNWLLNVHIGRFRRRTIEGLAALVVNGMGPMPILTKNMVNGRGDNNMALTANSARQALVEVLHLRPLFAVTQNVKETRPALVFLVRI